MGALNFPSQCNDADQLAGRFALGVKKIMATKKKAAKKTTAKKAVVGRVKLDFPIDAGKVEAIKRCLAKGSLKVTVTKADLLRGRLRDPYLYD